MAELEAAMNDQVTAAFELVGLWCIVSDCRAVYRDRAVRGVSVWSRGVYAAWAGWNVALFSELGMVLSASVAALTIGAYAVWLALAFRFRG